MRIVGRTGITHHFVNGLADDALELLHIASEVEDAQGRVVGDMRRNLGYMQRSASQNASTSNGLTTVAVDPVRSQDTGRVIHAPDSTLDSVGNVGDMRERAVLAASHGAREGYATGLAFCHRNEDHRCNVLGVTPAK